MSNRDDVVALFSGAGGLSLGFCQAGLKPVVAVDSDTDACATYCANLDIEVLTSDLSREDSLWKQIIAGFHEPFALIGGPPCQGFSSAGAKNGNDHRNRLIFRYLTIVNHLRPRWFLFENVEGLLTSNRGQSVADLVREFVHIGYRLRLEKVNCAGYGLPQARKRVILLGNRVGIHFGLPPQTHAFNAGKHKSQRMLPASPTLDEALAGMGHVMTHRNDISLYAAPEPLNDYDLLMREGNTTPGVSLHISSLSPLWSDIFARLRPGQTMKDLPTEYWHRSYERRAFRRVMDGTPTEKRGGAPSGIKRLAGHLNALTITSAATREFIHPHEDRPLTLREAARLQSFPDSYQFAGTLQSIARQIGNAFPPLVAHMFARHLMMLDGLAGGDQRAISNDNSGTLLGYRLTDGSGMSPALMCTDGLLAEIVGGQRMLPLNCVDMKEDT